MSILDVQNLTMLEQNSKYRHEDNQADRQDIPAGAKFTSVEVDTVRR